MPNSKKGCHNLHFRMQEVESHTLMRAIITEPPFIHFIVSSSTYVWKYLQFVPLWQVRSHQAHHGSSHTHTHHGWMHASCIAHPYFQGFVISHQISPRCCISTCHGICGSSPELSKKTNLSKPNGSSCLRWHVHFKLLRILEVSIAK